MMKRFYLSAIAVGATAALLTAGSFALFTANTSNMNNTFTAGTVSLSESFTDQLNFANIAPGDYDYGHYIQVSYRGDLDAWLGITVSTTGDLFAGATPMQAVVYDVTGGPVTAYAADGVTRTVVSTPVSWAYKEFVAIWYLPFEAGNSYQGATGSLTWSVKAVQSKNNTNGAGTGPNSW